MANHSANRGHWPAGKPRNNPAPVGGWDDPEDLLYAVRDFIASRPPVPAGQTDPNSVAGCARYCGIPRRTLRSWLDGTNTITTDGARKLSRWLVVRSYRLDQ